ncbi:serine/threonine-protein kinase [Amycolatopsis taiwanensis]|uniref:serine/threonine-protein kinase n=1 Tax=Amycolatopsis taiwanensis TaxID=342230 RepID=UPI000489A58A|nr:serine/threonine-protein kinase [Amycolatopsis taiwanensis]
MFHPGEVVGGRYVVREALGQGNSGEVYRVTDRETGARLVLKIQLARFFENTAEYEQYGEEILNEASVAEALSDVPGLLLARPGGDHAKRQFLVMPDVDGRDLVAFAGDEAPVSSARTAAIIAQLCDPLGELHARGWVHRDIKAENALIAPDGRVWLIDLGSAIPRDIDAGPQCTLGYAAPEVLQGSPATVASDVFSLGCLLFKLAIMDLPYDNTTGLRPVPGLPFPDRLGRSLEALAPELRSVGLRMIEWNPGDRPHAMAEVAGELARLLPDPATPAGS